ncbi:MAG: putative rane protein [Acidimicrobiales bacterium]|nr:putative rane protein [Acidimicrobiales bacterium]
MTDSEDAAPDAVSDANPDVRFSYANERTFLAWNRTALAMVTAGLAVTQLLPPFDVPGGRRMIGLPLIALGTLVAIASFFQWQRNERAMRASQPLPRSILPALVAVVVALSAIVALVLAALDGGHPS